MASLANWTENHDRIILETLRGSDTTAGKQKVWKQIGAKLDRSAQECLLRYKTVLASKGDDADVTPENNSIDPPLGLQYDPSRQEIGSSRREVDLEPFVALHRRLFPFEGLKNDWPESRGREAESMGYGEAGLASMGKIIAAVQAVEGMRQGGAFYDLGSGRGHAVLAAAAFSAGTNLFNKCVGIELHEPLHRRAVQDGARWDTEAKLLPGARPVVEFANGDFLESEWHDASMVIAVSTLFDADLMAKMAAKAESLPSGAVFVTVSHRLPSSKFTIQNMLQLPFSWTVDRGSYVFIQTKN